MKKIYRNCTITVERDQALGGWSEVYWSAFTDDGYEINAGFGGGTVWEMYAEMKEFVDLFLDEYKGDQEKWSKRWVI